ncbi:WYL domain-containing protein [Coleofasciculus sp. FACHB-64]|uniref:helix-turn-helix transcriptional regulator n=1 Tax=Cyanophyceae TaxID=3028117 RepID=UPI001686DAA7|nr:WYL domain-containing protein [Coleofasciculus sp. FACHB-64]MBD2045885.1 WYL domain-containing protein [Coleofasciculus sp. FACHB-64]
MSSDYNQIAFALEILKLLAEQPRKREELGNLLSEFLEHHGKASGDVVQKLTRTIRQLRGCGFEIKSAPHHPYELLESNFPVILSTEQRQALAMAAYFLADMGFSAQASQIIRIGKLSPTDQPPNVKVDFSPPVDYCDNQLDIIVCQLQERFKQQCRYTIRYKNPQGDERTWDMDRSELRLHNGVLYLFALVPDFPCRYIQTRPNIEQNVTFRVDRITSVGAASHIRWVFSSFPTLKVYYRMSGPLSTYQPRRNQEVVQHRDPQGKFVDIVTQEDCLFWFRQRILQYGSNAQVLKPEWLAQLIGTEFMKGHEKYHSI